MPELAEVEFNRRTWEVGLKQKITGIHLNREKRIFRGQDIPGMIQALTGSVFLHSEARGKQILCRFSNGVWIGLHLGMSGKLFTAGPGHIPEKHEHLVLNQKKQSLVFHDARLFGRILFDRGHKPPQWWRRLGPDLASPEFSADWVQEALLRHKKTSIKGVLLMQKWFPGIGNWMADEILWRAGILPERLAGKSPKKMALRLWKETRWVASKALKIIAAPDGNLPASWLFSQRWKKRGVCPKHGTLLSRQTIAGRTTAWCRRCQR